MNGELGFQVDRTSGKPLTTQVVDGVRWAIHSGRLRTGETLPSRETLMRLLGVSKNVVEACGHSAPTVVRLLERQGVPYVLLYAKTIARIDFDSCAYARELAAAGRSTSRAT